MKRLFLLLPILVLYLLKSAAGSDSWNIPYVRNSRNISDEIRLSDYKSSSSKDFKDEENCFKLNVDPKGNLLLELSCCISKGLIHKPEALVSVDPHRCQVFVCEKLPDGSVEIVSKSPVFRRSEAESGCCYKSGVMYKPGAIFFEDDRELTCCMGRVYATINEDLDEGLMISETTSSPKYNSSKAEDSEMTESPLLVQIGNRCPTRKCSLVQESQCSNSVSDEQRFDSRESQYAIFNTALNNEGIRSNSFNLRNSMKRDCKGNFYFASDAISSKEDSESSPYPEGVTGPLVKFTPDFKQSRSLEIDLDELRSPLIKDLRIDGKGQIHALVAYEIPEKEEKVTSVMTYDSCGKLLLKSDLLEGTFMSRDSYLTLDTADDVIVLNSKRNSSWEHPCRVTSLNGSTLESKWSQNIQKEGLSCLPTGIVTDCENDVYVSGFFGSHGGFVRKLDSSTGNEIWTVEEELLRGQITNLVLDVASEEIIVVVNNARIHRIKWSNGTLAKSAELLVKKLTILPSGEPLAFISKLEDRSHQIVMLNYDLFPERVYSIPWNDWDSIAWCNDLVEDVNGRVVLLSCAKIFNDKYDIIIFRIEV